MKRLDKDNRDQDNPDQDNPDRGNNGGPDAGGPDARGLDADAQRVAGVRRTGWQLLGMTLASFAVAFALVPLYDVFCEVTGLNGKTGRIQAADPGMEPGHRGRPVRVEFIANVNHGTALEFGPLADSLVVETGRIREIRYHVSNPTGLTLVARAVPSVAPARAARYFNKVVCFCFTEQLLEPGQSRDMSARFVVDPELPGDIRVITLSYTFFADTGSRVSSRAAEVESGVSL